MWELVTGVPAPALRGDVVGYHGFVERTPGPLRRVEVPTDVIPIIISLGPGIKVDGVQHTSFVAGVFDVPVVTEHTGVQEGIQVDVGPLAAGRLFGMPMAELTRQVVPLEDLLGGELIERLTEARDWPARFGLLDDAIGRRLAAAPQARPEVHATWARLLATGGGARVEDLAADVGWSRRHLAAQFRQAIGLPPKAMARVLRFQRMLGGLRAGRPLADLAYECGYADQAHLNRDFRQFAGTTPTRYLARSLPGGMGVAPDDGDLPFVQDEAVLAA